MEMEANVAPHLTRQLDIIPIETLGREITVIGAGAIGSFTVLALVKMGFANITVYDFDDVSIENMNCQWYRMKDIGKKKVQALQELIKDFTDVTINIKPVRFEAGELRGIVISAVDSMEARKVIWNAAKKSFGVSWFIDPRMASEYALAFVMKPDDEADQKSYETTLYSDANAVQERCTAKATMYTATMIAGYVAKAVKDIVTGNKYARVSHWDIGLNNLQNWGKSDQNNI